MTVTTRAKVPAWWRETKERIRRKRPLPQRLVVLIAKTSEAETAAISAAWEAEQRELIRLLMAYERAFTAVGDGMGSYWCRMLAQSLSCWQKGPRPLRPRLAKEDWGQPMAGTAASPTEDKSEAAASRSTEQGHRLEAGATDPMAGTAASPTGDKSEAAASRSAEQGHRQEAGATEERAGARPAPTEERA